MIRFKPRPKTTSVILHCTHTETPKPDLGHWLEVKGREMGLLEVGYHFVIYQDGHLLTCRPHNAQGSHCPGHNRTSIGVCLEGGLGGLPVCDHCGSVERCHTKCDWEEEHPQDNFTAAQKDTLRWLMGWLEPHYGKLPLFGHTEVGHHKHRAKPCPPIDMEKLRDWLKSPTLTP